MQVDTIKFYLQSINFYYFAYLGLFFKFFSIFLKDELGFDEEQIGFIFMMVPLTHIFVTFLLGFISNKFRQEERLLRILTLMSFVFSVFYLFIDKDTENAFLAYIIVTILLSIFRNPIMPIVDSTTLAYVMKHGGSYSGIRVWGSVGFIFATIVLGKILDYSEVFPIESTLYAMSLFMLLSYLSSLKIPVKPAEKTGIQIKEVLSHLKDPQLTIFFLASFIHLLGMAAYHEFFGLYVKELHFNYSYIGWFTIASVVPEIILFNYSNRILSKFPPFILLTFTFFITAIRWWMLSYFHDLFTIMLSQTFHAFSWGLFFITSISYIDHRFKDRLRTSGITLYSTIVFGLGNAVGFYLAGLISDRFDFVFLFEACTFLALLSFVISLYLSFREDKSFRLK